MGDKHRFDPLIFQTQEAHHPEKEAFGDIFFAGRHRRTAVHEHVHRRLGVHFLVRIPDFEAQIGVVQFVHLGVATRGIALEVGEERAPFVQIGHGAAAPYVRIAVRRGGHLPLWLFLEPGQGQVLEHHLRQLFQWHLDFVGVFTRLLAGLTVAWRRAMARPAAHGIPRLSRSLSNP